MARPKQIFADGEVIFHEGDPSDRAFELVSGEVVFTKGDGDKEVSQGRITPGNLFGEMGILEGGRRAATARAAGRVVVRIVDREDFLQAMRETPESALGIVSRLVRRLRGNDGRAAKPKGGGASAAAYSNPGLLRRLIDGLGNEGERLGVRIAQFTGDNADEHTRHVTAALGNTPVLQTRIIAKSLAVDPNGDPLAELNHLADTARKWLADVDADVLVWGHVPAPGDVVHLRFVTIVNWDQQAPGAFDLDNEISLPAAFGAEHADLLRAVVIAATVPTTAEKKRTRLKALPDYVEKAAAALGEVPPGMTTRERASLEIGYANTLAAASRPGYTPELLARAAEHYRAAAGQLSETEMPADWALAQRHLGAILHIEAERNHDADLLVEAERRLRDALDLTDRDIRPRPWAVLQNRIGLICYRRGFNEGDTELLRQSLKRFQLALQVFGRKDIPGRWAEIMMNFAQAAQVLGGHVKSLEALATAANACRAVLEVRSRERQPLLWAATQNNLGSALFLLGKQTHNVERLESAVVAFERALEVYEAQARHRMAAVTAKNLERARDLVAEFQPRSSDLFDWEDEAPALGDFEDTDTGDDTLPVPGEGLKKDPLPFPGEALASFDASVRNRPQEPDDDPPFPGEALIRTA